MVWHNRLSLSCNLRVGAVNRLTDSIIYLIEEEMARRVNVIQIPSSGTINRPTFPYPYSIATFLFMEAIPMSFVRNIYRSCNINIIERCTGCGMECNVSFLSFFINTSSPSNKRFPTERVDALFSRSLPDK